MEMRKRQEKKGKKKQVKFGEKSNSHISGKLKLESLTLEVHQVSNESDKQYISEEYSILALKNESTYLIATDLKGMKVIKDNILVFLDALPTQDFIGGLVYVDYLDCFLLLSGEILYRKEINNKAPSVYIDLKLSAEVILGLRYSRMNKKLITFIDYKNLAVINIDEKRLDLVFEKEIGESVRGYKIFGEQEKKVIAITEDGYVVLYVFNYEMRKLAAIGHHKIKLIKEIEESGLSLAVSDDNDYVLVEIIQNDNRFCSRMMVFQIDGLLLIQKAVFDAFSAKTQEKCCLQSVGCFGSHVFWVGLESFERAQIYVYDIKSGHFKELEEKRVEHREEFPTDIHRIENHLYYTGGHGRIMRLTVKF